MRAEVSQAAASASEWLAERGRTLSPSQQAALTYLIDYAKGDPERPPALWHCDIDCRCRMGSGCRGRYGRNEQAAVPCPYFVEMLY